MRKIVAILSVFLMTILIFPKPVNADVMTMQADISFDQNNKSVDVSPGSDCTVIFSGNINYSYSSLVIVHISTHVTDAPGWKVATNPTRCKGEAGTHSVQITLTVHVPPETSEGATGIITVTVTIEPYYISVEPGIKVSTDVVVSVKPYHKLSLSCPTPYMEIGPGSETYFNLQITNLGNNNDTFEIGIENEGDFPGWVIQKECSSVYIPEKSTENVRIRIMTPRDWTLWEDDIVEIKINATSSGSDETVSENYPVYLRQRGTYIPGFDPTVMIIALGIIAIMLRRKRKC